MEHFIWDSAHCPSDYVEALVHKDLRYNSTAIATACHTAMWGRRPILKADEELSRFGGRKEPLRRRVTQTLGAFLRTSWALFCFAFSFFDAAHLLRSAGGYAVPVAILLGPSQTPGKLLNPAWVEFTRQAIPAGKVSRTPFRKLASVAGRTMRRCLAAWHLSSRIRLAGRLLLS